MPYNASNDPAASQVISARQFAAVTPSDSTDLGATRALWVGTGGSVAIMGIGDTVAVTHTNVPDGSRLDVAVKRVMSTNTTATNIVAWY